MNRNCLLRVSLIALGLASHAFAGQRFNVSLQGGRVVQVVNASHMSKDWVTGHIVVADRSTQEDCVYGSGPHAQGLFRTGDKFCVTDNYVAWFDHTRDTQATSGFRWSRSGVLTGIWTVDPTTNYFKFMRPNSCGQGNWAHNELVPGTALRPASGLWWWDKYAPPIDYVVNVVTSTNPVTHFFGGFHYAQDSTNGNWSVLTDGASYTDGVHFKMSAWLSNDSFQGTFNGQHIESQLEYVCRPRDILSIWTFRPSATVQADVTFEYVWAAHSLDEDGTGQTPLGCDVSPATDDYPATRYGTPLYATASQPLSRVWDQVGWQQCNTSNVARPRLEASRTLLDILQMEPGPICPCAPNAQATHANRDIFFLGPSVGDWITWGEASDLSPAEPTLTLTLEPLPGSVPPGTQRVPFNELLFANETYDGVLGGGLSLQAPLPSATTYSGGVWYGDAFSLRTSEGSGSAPGDFNHDGKSEIVLQNAGTKSVSVWHMDGVQRLDVATPNPAQPGDANWELTATADFNNDNKADLLWRNTTTAKTVTWFMDNDLNRCAGAFTNPAETQDHNWIIVGAGDFAQVSGQDGRADIVWQNLDSRRVVIWTMTFSGNPAPSPASGCPLPGQPTGQATRQSGAFVSPDPAADQNVVAVADFNLDGYADLVLENSLGQVQLWTMNGLTRVSQQTLSLGGLGGDPNWRIVGTGFFNEDQAPDLLWRNSVTGQLKTWFMDQTNPVFTVDVVLENGSPAYVTYPWNVVGPR